MGVLYCAEGLHLPSVLWMRRMLDALEDDVAALATDEDFDPQEPPNYRVVVLRDSAWSWWWRACHRLGLTAGIRKTARVIRTLKEAVESPDVGVVLIHYLTSAVKYDRVWMRTSKPVFVHCHGWDVTWDLRLHEAPEQAAHPRDYVERVRALPAHVHFIANSEQTRRRLCAVGIAEGRVHLKYLGVPIPESPPRIRRQRSGGLTVLYLGRLVDCKGPELVIRAFDRACERGLRGRLIIAGDGPMRQTCERAREAASHSAWIELVGAVDADTGASLRESADIFTAHNRLGPITGQEEAFGVSFVEAMAQGLPVVSGRSGSLPELIEDGVQGILVEPGDVEGHAEALLRLARDPDLRTRLGRSGWERARERFSIEREAHELRRILGVGRGT